MAGQSWLTPNLRLIEAKHPQLAAQVRATPRTVRHAKGQLLVPHGGQTVPVPNREALGNAEQAADTILGSKASLILYSGCGAGYVPRALATRMPETTRLLVQEQRLDIFKGMLTAFDCSTLLGHPRVDLAIGDVPLAPYVQGHLIRHGHDLQIAHDQQQWDLHPPYAGSINDQLIPFVQDFQINFNTMTHFGPLFTENCIRQIPACLTAFGVEVLQDQFAGFPAVVIGGGPSLSRNVEVVRGFKGKGVIICADTVLGYLLARGIAPDFVVSVDPQDTTYRKYQELAIPDDTALVFHPGNRYEIANTWPKDKYHTGTNMYPYSWADPFLGKRAVIDGNIHCQVHYGCNLAVHMGCKPIALVGMDLCFTDNRYHAAGASYMNEEQEAAHVAPGQPAKDIFGQDVNTIPIFLNYRHILETKAEEQPNRYVYATEGGLGVPGVINVPLAEVLHQGGIGRYVSVAERRRWCHQKAAPINRQGLLEEGWRHVYELQAAATIATKIQRLLEAGGEETTLSRRLSLLMAAYTPLIASLGLIHLIAAREEQTYMHSIQDYLDREPDRALRFHRQRDRAHLWTAPFATHAPRVAQWLTEMLDTLGPRIPKPTYHRWKKGLV